jgi:tetratricopeptide (TPR) repeat protein
MCHHNFGIGANARGNFVEAENHWKQALIVYMELKSKHPERRQNSVNVAKTQVNLSVLLQGQRGRQLEARDAHDQAVSTLEELVHSDRHDHESIETLATLRLNWAYVLRDTDQPDLALADLDKNITLLTEVLQHEPNLAGIRDKMYRTYGTRAIILDGLGRKSDAVIAYEQVVVFCDPSNLHTERISLALRRQAAGEFQRAAVEADALLAELPKHAAWSHFYNIALVYAQTVWGAAHDKSLSEEDRDAKIERYASSALQCLEKARTNAGETVWEKEVSYRKLIKDFQSRREREDFRRFVQRKP